MKINHFEILAHGAAFDVDAYMSRSTLPVTSVFHRGERHYKTSGITIILGDGQTIPLYEQDRIAAEFLLEHRDALRALGTEPGIELATVRLHHRIVVYEGLTGFSVGPSTLLMQRALEVGFELSFFNHLIHE